MVPAHRWAYEQANGPIHDGFVLDHEHCDNPRCVNPAHLAPKTNRENLLRGKTLAAENARKTHCKRGHRFDEANTYVERRGSRHCRTCQRARKRARRAANNADALIAALNEEEASHGE